jgi:thioesterase DpgC
MTGTLSESARKAEANLRERAESIYLDVTDNCRRPLRVSELLYEAAERFPGTLPSRAEIEHDRQLPWREKRRREIEQGIFISHVLAKPQTGLHLLESMSRPTKHALALLHEFQSSGHVDLGPVRADRKGIVGEISLQNHAVLNAEDNLSTAALEVAIDLVLLDPTIEVGVLRGAPSTHPKHAGRRIFGSGVNLTHLYQGRISLSEFMIERELGGIHKAYRGHWGEGERGREKPWIGVVDSWAIGGGFQWLLVMDRVIAEPGAYFSLPARKEGIIPGCAALRLPRLVGERLARKAILFNRVFSVDGPEARLLVDEVARPEEIESVVERFIGEFTASGRTALLANRASLRLSQEPLDHFRVYMSHYARAQAECLYSTTLLENLERNWLRRS